MQDNQVPLIWTTKGNLPISSLEYRHEWSEDDNEICFVEEYRLDGEIVKRSVHLCLRKGLLAIGEAAQLG